MTNQAPACSPDARSGEGARDLLARIVNDRFGAEHVEPYARGWNDCSRHVERILVGLRELAEAKAMDLRVKTTLTGCL